MSSSNAISDHFPTCGLVAKVVAGVPTIRGFSTSGTSGYIHYLTYITDAPVPED